MDKLIGFGASSVEGVGDSQGGFFKRLGAKLATVGKPHECLNFGIGGNTTRDMLPRIDQVRPHLPARVVVLLGSNDFVREADPEPLKRVPLTEHAQNVADILDVLGGPGTIFVSSFAVCQRRTGISPSVFASYMSEALKIATKRPITIWDLHAESLAWGDRYLAEDGLHYNDAGHELIAERLLGMVR